MNATDHSAHWDAVEDAVELLHDERVDEALPLLRAALERDPGNVYAHFHLGTALASQVAPRAALPPTERPGAVVILGPDPSVGRVRPREPPSDEPYYLERGIVSRAGPRWIARATRAPVAANDPAFAQWSRRRQKLEDQRWGGGELGDLGL